MKKKERKKRQLGEINDRKRERQVWWLYCCSKSAISITLCPPPSSDDSVVTDLRVNAWLNVSDDRERESITLCNIKQDNQGKINKLEGTNEITYYSTCLLDNSSSQCASIKHLKTGKGYT